MITFMRRYRKGLQVGLLVVIAAFVASLFVFGSSGFDKGRVRGDSVASVNGETISRQQYQERLDVYRERLSLNNQARRSAGMVETLGLPQRVIDELVTEVAVEQRAHAEGLAMSDEEFNAAVHAMREFQDNGRFSIERYRRFLQARGVEGER